MNKTIKILIAVFVSQVLLTAGLFYTSGIISPPPEKQLLLNLSKNNIEKIILGGPGNKEVVLKKVDKVWSLPNKNNFPANQAQINQLLDRLFETELGTKISQQNSSHERLRVSDSGFERKVSLFTQNGNSSIIYFGSAPSLRQSHARLAQNTDVHVVKFSANDIEIQSNDWLKKDIFTIPTTEIEEVAFAKIILSRVTVDGVNNNPQSTQNSKENLKVNEQIYSWSASGLKNKKLSNSSAKEFINKIADMRINGIANKKSLEKIDKSKKSNKYTITLNGNKKITYELLKLKGEEDFLLFTSQREGIFRLPPLSGKDLIDSSKIGFLTEETKKNVDD
jgi:hypothetical protein